MMQYISLTMCGRRKTKQNIYPRSFFYNMGNSYIRNDYNVLSQSICVSTKGN